MFLDENDSFCPGIITVIYNKNKFISENFIITCFTEPYWKNFFPCEKLSKAKFNCYDLMVRLLDILALSGLWEQHDHLFSASIDFLIALLVSEAYKP